MFPNCICQNIDILVIVNVWEKIFGFHSNQKTQGHWLNNLYFKYQIYKIKLRHLHYFLQFRLLFHEPHCKSSEVFNGNLNLTYREFCRTCRTSLQPLASPLGPSVSFLWRVEIPREPDRRYSLCCGKKMIPYLGISGKTSRIDKVLRKNVMCTRRGEYKREHGQFHTEEGEI